MWDSYPVVLTPIVRASMVQLGPWFYPVLIWQLQPRFLQRFGILVYREETSNVTRSAPSGSLSMDHEVLGVSNIRFCFRYIILNVSINKFTDVTCWMTNWTNWLVFLVLVSLCILVISKIYLILAPLCLGRQNSFLWWFYSFSCKYFADTCRDIRGRIMSQFRIKVWII